MNTSLEIEFGNAVEAVLSGHVRTVPAETEADFHIVWHDHGLGAQAPIQAAWNSGARADRLSWVFISGYQAALRAIFPGLPASGWAAFVASEPRGEQATTRPTHVEAATAGLTLTGVKSWVAQSRQVRHLLVTAQHDEAGTVWWVDACAEGVTLEHRDPPKFLPSLSQGTAIFDRVLLAPDARLEDSTRRAFARIEGRFVMLAACAFMLAHTVEAGAGELADELVTVGLALAFLSADPETPAVTIGRVDGAYRSCVEQFTALAAAANIPDWTSDQRLLLMYSDAIQRRAERYSSPGTP